MKVCRVCLAMNVKMYHISEHRLSIMYELITGVEIITEDELPKMLCWECVARLSSAYNFIKKALKTNLLLVDKLKSSRCISMDDIESVDKTQLESTLGIKVYRENFCNVHIIKESDNINEHLNKKEEQIFVTDVTVETDAIKIEYIDETEAQKAEDEYNIKADIDNDINEIKFQHVVLKTEPIEVIENEYLSDKMLMDDDSYAGEKSDEVEYKHVVNEWSKVDLSKQDQKSNKPSEVLPRCKELRVVVEDIMLNPTTDTTQDMFKYRTDKDLLTNSDVNFSQGTINENIIIKDETQIDTPCENSSLNDPVSVWSGSVDYKFSPRDDAVSSSELLVCGQALGDEASLLQYPNCSYNTSKHTNNSVFTCEECSFETSVKTRFKYHVQSKHSNISFNCTHCDFVTNVKSRLIGHINAKHTKSIAFNCSYCSFSTHFKASLDRHVNSKHTKNNVFNCSYCDYKTYIKSTLNIHINTKHTKNNVFSCSYCDYKTYQNYLLNAHINTEHTKTNVYNCSHCSYKTYVKYKLNEHVNAKHTGNNVFNCSLCDFKTCDKWYLKDHINSRHTKTDVFYCSLCNYETYNKKLLKRHIDAKHTKINVLNCSFCDYETYKKVNLESHVNAKHTKVNVFSCTYCSFKSHRKSNLNVHVNAKHTKIHTFKCSYCNYTAYEKRLVKGHMNANHTKVKVFICDYCSFQVYYKANLVKHIKTKHS